MHILLTLNAYILICLLVRCTYWVFVWFRTPRYPPASSASLRLLFSQDTSFLFCFLSALLSGFLLSVSIPPASLTLLRLCVVSRSSLRLVSRRLVELDSNTSTPTSLR
ncbi:hypothetical protein L226DRAFT_241522 [Lentinus tigrinus ALCF2SS1-7]|uniref:Uncharacterized protein n=1 Tax=Lentinus tigrinus ALCF2SS1-6 TaxID=1328759 RepID=A0A5C2SNW2_9APHY|nr:hypothetical protein L227DRAFT_212445 [Lentinus tigrinus ALCF2SS1-6]RPD79137.1 hypothetical protein L226DRAFT_241522 [Lentinus tigrinus ALCF2SS1-7]